LEMIPLDKIRISAFNVRADEPFGDEEDQALVESIGSFGVLQPVIVRPVGDMYELTAGRRRLFSARESGLTEIPCIIKDVDDEETMYISLIENIQRKDVDPVTLGRAVSQVLKREGISPGKLARKIGKSKQTIHNWINTLNLSPAMQREIQCGTVPLRDALKVFNMKLSPEVEDTLAEEARVDGLEVFKKTLDRISHEQEKRGAPRDLLITRQNWGKVSPKYEKLKKRAAEASLDLDEYCKKVLAASTSKKFKLPPT